MPLYEVHCRKPTENKFRVCKRQRGALERAAIIRESSPSRAEIFQDLFLDAARSMLWCAVVFKSDAALAAAQKTKYTAEKNAEMEKSRALFVCSLWRQTNTRQELPLKVPERVTTLGGRRDSAQYRAHKISCIIYV